MRCKQGNSRTRPIPFHKAEIFRGIINNCRPFRLPNVFSSAVGLHGAGSLSPSARDLRDAMDLLTIRQVLDS
jgi:hypothetical protein